MLANLACPFGVGCQLSGSQGGGISDSASRGKGDFPFPHEDRRDVTLGSVSMCFIAVGWTAAASAGQDPLSLPGCCLAGSCLSGSCLSGCCRRSATYGYGRLRLSDAGEGVWEPFFVFFAENSYNLDCYLYFCNLNNSTNKYETIKHNRSHKVGT